MRGRKLGRYLIVLRANLHKIITPNNAAATLNTTGIDVESTLPMSPTAVLITALASEGLVNPSANAAIGANAIIDAPTPIAIFFNEITFLTYVNF